MDRHPEVQPPNRALGAAGEDAVVRWYRARGFRVIARNWRCPMGEIDVVVARGDLLVFCEAKARSGSSLGAGFEAVGGRKQRKLRQLAEIFLAQRGRSAQPAVRFDVASVRFDRVGGPVEVHVFEDAF